MLRIRTPLAVLATRLVVRSVTSIACSIRARRRDGSPPWKAQKQIFSRRRRTSSDAIGEREMEDYQTDLTRALANLGLAVGRPSQDGVLGGLSGALANTELGVPAGALRVAGCSVPARAPAYGLVSGQLVYVALPRAAAAAQLPSNLDVRSIVVRGDDVVLYTARAAACRAAAYARHRSARVAGAVHRSASPRREPPFTRTTAYNATAPIFKEPRDRPSPVRSS